MSGGLHIQISLGAQSLELQVGGSLLARYPVSTSKYGPGTEEGSYKTPLGTFRICEKIGEGAPPHTIFRAREPVGIWDPGQASDEDLILTRILRLEGLEEANANTRQRFIYIHGTNQEDRLGFPASCGCVRMGNVDIIELFDLVPTRTTVVIDR